MDAIDKAYHAESRFIAQCSDIDVLIDRVADYREDARVAAQRGETKARLRMADLLELAEDRITELKVLALNKGRKEEDRARQRVVDQRPVEREHAERQAREQAAQQAAREREVADRQRQIAADKAAREAQVLRTKQAEIKHTAPEQRVEPKQGPVPERGQRAMAAHMGASGATPLCPPTPSHPKVPAPSVNVGAGNIGSRLMSPQRIVTAHAATQGQGVRAVPPVRMSETPTRAPVLPACAVPPAKTSINVVAGAPRIQTLPSEASSGHSVQKPAAVPSSVGPIYTGTDLVRYRTERGLTQRQAAEQLGVAHGTIAKAEMGLAKPLGEALQAGMHAARLQ